MLYNLKTTKKLKIHVLAHLSGRLKWATIFWSKFICCLSLTFYITSFSRTNHRAEFNSGAKSRRGFKSWFSSRVACHFPRGIVYYQSMFFLFFIFHQFWKMIFILSKMCLSNTNAPNNGQYQIWPRSKGQINWYQCKDFVTRNAPVQYESSNIILLWITFFFKNISNV